MINQNRLTKRGKIAQIPLESIQFDGISVGLTNQIELMNLRFLSNYHEISLSILIFIWIYIHV